MSEKDHMKLLPATNPHLSALTASILYHHVTLFSELRGDYMVKKSDSKLYAFLGVLLGIIGFLIVWTSRNDDKYALYYAKHGLVLNIAAILVFIPVIGWFVISFALIALTIITLINSQSGKMKPTPLITYFAEKIKV